MKRAGAIICVIAALLACGAALAQERSDDAFWPVWIERPTGRSFERWYPPAALNAGVHGTAVLCCTPTADRRITCRVGLEWPEGQGFGYAAQNIARDFKMSEQSYAEFRADPSNWMQVPITFMVGDVDSRAFHQALAQIQESARGLCRPRAAPISTIEPTRRLGSG